LPMTDPRLFSMLIPFRSPAGVMVPLLGNRRSVFALGRVRSMYLRGGFVIGEVVDGNGGRVADDDGVSTAQEGYEIINPGASGQLSGAGELVVGFGKNPMFRPVDPSRVVADGMRAGASVAAAVGRSAVDPVWLEAPTARPADQQAGQSVATFAVVVGRAGSANGLGGEEVRSVQQVAMRWRLRPGS
jgi:hypothetical protein